MTPYEQVKQAYLHLCWAIKLSSYLSLHPPKSKIEFDQGIKVTDPEDPHCIPANQFTNMDDIHLGAENSILLSVGAFFLALDTALDEAGYNRNAETDDSLGQLRILIYMCRCAFAHNVLRPHWEVRGKYLRNLAIEDKGIKIAIDLNLLNGKEFNINQIGGYSQLFQIKDCTLSMLNS